MDSNNIGDFIRYSRFTIQKNKQLILIFTAMSLIIACSFIFYIYRTVVVLSVVAEIIVIISTVVYKNNINKHREILLLYNGIIGFTFNIPAFNICFRVILDNRFISITGYTILFISVLTISVIGSIVVTKWKIGRGVYYEKEKQAINMNVWGIAAISYMAIAFIVKTMTNWIVILFSSY